MHFPHDYMDGAAGAPVGGIPSRCGVPAVRGIGVEQRMEQLPSRNLVRYAG